MKYYKLNDLCTDIIDCPHSTPEWKSEGIRVVRNFNLRNGNLDFSDGYFVDEETYLERIKRAIPEEGDIIISREAPMGVVAIVPKGLKCCLGQRLVLLKIDKKKINPFYLLFILMSDFVQTQFRRADATGSIVSNLCIPDLKDIVIPVIDVGQENVAELLKNINDKIQLNKKINDNLQQQLKLLYDYWFTQFDFPDENGKPYRSSGNPMVWNENLKRNIPQQWHCAYLKDILQPAGEQICNIKSHEELFYTPIDIIPKHTISFAGGLPSEDAKSSLQIYRKNNLLLGAMRVYFHRVCIAAQDGITRTTTMILSPVKDMNYLGYCYSVLNSDDTILYATRHSSGTQQPYINWTDALENYAFAMPDSKELIDRYSQIAAPLIEEAQKREQENLELTQLRDWLLPMLMNGQATISD